MANNGGVFNMKKLGSENMILEVIDIVIAEDPKWLVSLTI